MSVGAAWSEVAGRLCALPDEVQCALWVVLLCAAGVALVWAWRRWRWHRRGVATWGLVIVAILSLVAAVGVARTSVIDAGFAQMPEWLDQMGSLAAVESRTRETPQYREAVDGLLSAAVQRSLTGAEEHARFIVPHLYPVEDDAEGHRAVVCFQLLQQPNTDAMWCRAVCVVVRVNGQSLRGPEGQLVSTDLGFLGPVVAQGDSVVARDVNLCSTALVCTQGRVLRSGETLGLDWALVLVGPDNATSKLLRRRSEVVVGPPVRIEP